MAGESENVIWHEDLTVFPTITSVNVDKFVKTQSLAAETSIRGYKFFVESYIYDFKVRVRPTTSSDPYSIRGRCYRSMRKNDDSHHVQVNFDDLVQPKSWSCSCAAGAALCHHSLALLYQLQHYQKLGLKAVPPILSKTSMPQSWHVPSRHDGIPKRPIDEVVVQKPNPKRQASSTDNRSVDGVSSKLFNPITTPLHDIELPRKLLPFFNNLQWKQRPQFSQLWGSSSANNVETSLSKFGTVPKGSVLSYQQKHVSCLSGDVIVDGEMPCMELFIFPDLSGACQKFLPLPYDLSVRYHSLMVTEAQSREYEEKTRLQSVNPDWHSLRKNRVTASKFKRICSRRGDHQSLARSLIGGKTVQTAAMRYGVENEPIAAELYSRTFGRNVYSVGFVINPSVFFLGCSPDRRVYDPDCDRPWGILEIKCTESTSVDQLSYLKCNESGTKSLATTHEYYYQVMGQMGLTGSTWCDFFVFAKDDYHVERILFDSTLFDEMLLKLTDFFFNSYLSCT